jgi:cell wall assembly regulator SMI1
MSSLIALEEWLGNNLPEVLSDLNPGVTEDELRAFAAAINAPLPAEYVALYRWHNGQKMEIHTGPWYGLIFIPLTRVLSEWQSWVDVLRQSKPETLASLNSGNSSVPPRFVRCLYASDRWIPFAYDWAGNYLGIDLDPDEDGTIGQVINFGRDEERKIAIAPNIEEFVAWMVSELKSGNFNIKTESDGGRSFNTLRPEKYHFLDSLAVMFCDS